MDKVTQANAAAAEETAASSEELTSQGQQLRSVVQQLLALVQGGHGDLAAVGDRNESAPRSRSMNQTVAAPVVRRAA